MEKTKERLKENDSYKEKALKQLNNACLPVATKPITMEN